MPGTEDNPANRRQSDSRESADRILEEMLRQIAVDILNEPVPEKLRRVLHPKAGENAASNNQDDPPRRDEAARARDDEPSPGC